MVLERSHNSSSRESQILKNFKANFRLDHKKYSGAHNSRAMGSGGYWKGYHCGPHTFFIHNSLNISNLCDRINYYKSITLEENDE